MGEGSRGGYVAERYRITRRLGRGGQSHVYIAADERHDDGQVVIKHMICRGDTARARQEELELFLQEARILAEVEHVSLPRLIDSFEDTAGHYVVEELVGESSLEAILRDRVTLTPQEVAFLGHRLLDLLSFLHNHRPSVVLRDIKPSNITCWVDDEGFIRRDRPIYFVDLTIALHFVPGQEDAVKMGSPGFAPPEQYRGRSQPRSDLYALGVTMFAALTGHDPVRTPFRMPSVSALRPDVPASWEAFLEKAMALEPGHRFQSAKVMQEELDRLLPVSRCLEPLQRPRRRKVLSGRGLALVLLAAALCVLTAVISIGG